MNERIRELAIEAGDDWEHTLKEDREFLEKFAELIVQECANICFEQSEISWNDDHKIQAKIDGHLIKKHFGVEE